METELCFRPLTLADKDILQSYTCTAGQRNCNYSFANLAAWQPIFRTCFATTSCGLMLRYYFSDEMAYMLVQKDRSYDAVVQSLRLMLKDADAQGKTLNLLGAEDDVADIVRRAFGSQVEVTPLRDSYDYIYRREALAALTGGELKAKRNHVNKFRSLYPHYEYRPLTPDLFDQCMALEERWRNEARHSDPPENEHDSIAAEKQVMQFTFQHWEELGTRGGALFVDNNMIAFTYGGPITPTTFDVCVEKADTAYEGAFTVINQEFCRHLPGQFIFVNREEDMGLPGLRKAKSSYHPEVLLSYNAISFATHEPHYHLERCLESRDKEETCTWMCRQYGFEWEPTMQWLTHLHINWPLSVRARQDDNTIGLLTMSDYHIEEETEVMQQEQPELLAALNQYRYTAVFSFIVAPDHKGTKLNYDMLMNVMPELKQYDFIFVPVMHQLKTHTYWKRWGALFFYQDAISKYYLIPHNPQVIETLKRFGLG